LPLFSERANHHKAEEVRAEQSTAKGKGRALPECTRCTDRGLECELGPGKSTSCVACREGKLKCERPGMEAKGKSERRRKRVEEESPRGKKKKARTTEESEAGPSGKKTKELGAVTIGGEPAFPPQVATELRELLRGLYRRLDDQNKYLARLVELKAVEVYGDREESEDLEADTELEEGEVEALDGPDVPVPPGMEMETEESEGTDDE